MLLSWVKSVLAASAALVLLPAAARSQEFFPTDGLSPVYAVPPLDHRWTLVIRDPVDQRRIHVVVPHLSKVDCEAQKAAILPDVRPTGAAFYPLQVAVCMEVK